MRVAVCLYGEPRTYKYTAKYLKEHYEKIGNNEVDYFGYIWAEEGKDVCRPESRKSYIKDDLQEDLNKLYNTSHIQVKDSKLYLEKSRLFRYPNLYNAQVKSLELALEQCIDYDLYILDRLDTIKYQYSYDKKNKKFHFHVLGLDYCAIPGEVFSGKAIGTSQYSSLDEKMRFKNSFFKHGYVGDRILCMSRKQAFNYATQLLPWMIHGKHHIGYYSEEMLNKFFVEYIRVGYVNGQEFNLEPGWILRKHCVEFVETEFKLEESEDRLGLISILCNSFDKDFNSVLGYKWVGNVSYSNYENSLKEKFYTRIRDNYPEFMDKYVGKNSYEIRNII